MGDWRWRGRGRDVDLPELGGAGWMKDDEPPALCSVPIILGVDVEVFGLLNKNGTG